MTTYRVRRDTFHYHWSRGHKPVLHTRPGDRVKFEVNDVTSWQVKKRSPAVVLAKLDSSKLYPLSGPVSVEGAARGDALLITVNEVRTADWGYSAIIPGMGLLEEFAKPFLWHWDLSRKTQTEFKKGISIPLRPFLGVMGVAPDERGEFEVRPPGKHGGNLDTRHLTKGSKLWLPVWTDGALFSVGDLHGAQGDGEVCLTAVECAGVADLTIELVKGANIEYPRFSTELRHEAQSDYFATTGIASDLMTASKESVRGMIAYLGDTYGLTAEEAYVLCSVAADLRIHEVVDKPNWVVGTMIPLKLFACASKTPRIRTPAPRALYHRSPFLLGSRPRDGEFVAQ